ncbi:hypothetical protein FRC20_003555 [Serendipita sp. 405]|nr:hypothetical protein FRC20_003555 [Serendipita sp. 405]
MSANTDGFNWADEVEEQLFRNENNAQQVNEATDSNWVVTNSTRESQPQYRFYKPGVTRPSPIFNIHSEDARYAYLSPESPLAEEPTHVNLERGPGMETDPYLGGRFDDNQMPEWRRDAGGQGSPATPWSNPNKKKKKGKQRRQDNYYSSQKIRSPDDYYEAQAMNDPYESMFPTADRILEPVKAPEVPEELDLWAADKKKKRQVYH